MAGVSNSRTWWTMSILMTAIVTSSGVFAADDSVAYLLITNLKLAPAFQPLVDRRTSQGFPGKLITVEDIYDHYPGIDEPEQIRNCIIDHYNRYGTQYVALGGDDTIVPVRYCCPRSVEEKIPADLYYSDTDGGGWNANRNGIYGEVGDISEIELTPDVHLGRIPVRRVEEAAAYVNKIVIYEAAPSDEFANSLIILGGTKALLSGNSRPADFCHHDPVEVREVGLAGYYLDWIQPYWQAVPFHLYCDTSTPWDENNYGDYGLNADRLVEHLSEGPFSRGYHFVLFSGHANYSAYALGLGRRFNTGHASALTNAMPSIFISGGCGPAGFDQAEPCLSEALLRNPFGGAIAFFGYARSVSDGSHRDHLFLSVFEHCMKTSGEAISHCKTALASKYVANPYHHYNFHLQGDPCIQFLGEESGRHLQLFQPKGCEVIQNGSDLYIRWNAAGTGFSPQEYVRLQYSHDSGQTWHSISHADALPYDGRLFIWEKCSLPPGSTYRMRVFSLANPNVSDSSTCDFTIADLGFLTVQSRPVTGVAVPGRFNGVTEHTLVSNFNISVIKNQRVILNAPEIPEGMRELLFSRWADDIGNTLCTTPGYTFTFTYDTTIKAEYTSSRQITHYYVNDETAENSVAAGDDRNDGLSPNTPKRHIKAVLDAYPALGIGNRLRVSDGLYEENLSLSADNTGLEIVGAGQDTCIIDGGGQGSCIKLDGFQGGMIFGLTFQNGLSDRGGGIYCYNSSPVIRECTFTDNTANSYGGAMFVRSSSPDISNCTFIGNSSKRGGGLCDYGGASVIRECLIANNDASVYGGGLYETLDGKSNLKNCIFHGNSARRGGAIAVTDDLSHITMVNCTLGSNPSRSGSREIIWIIVPGATVELKNCILYDSAPPTATLIAAEGNLDIRYSLVRGARDGINEGQTADVSWGPGNINADPLFADLAGSDYHLKSRAGRWLAGSRFGWIVDNVTSPCIDAGDPEMPVGDEPEPNGGRINMGAYGGTAEASKSP